MVTGNQSNTTPALTISEVTHRTSQHSMALHHSVPWDCWRFLATVWISSFIPKRIHTAGTKVIAVNCSMHHAKGLATIWMIKPFWLKKFVFHAQPVRYLSWKSQAVEFLAVVYRAKNLLGSNTIICERTPKSCNLNGPTFDWNINN